MNKEFRHRGEEQTRLETFSDAVFALAVTLLLISTTPPVTFYQLKIFTKDIISFALCFTLLALIWYEHFKFFFRYGFRNVQIVVLNTLFLFIVLFYVYPLKFLCKILVIIFKNLFLALLGKQTDWEEYLFLMDGGSQADMMTIYGLGGASVFLVLALMYRYAYTKREDLELNSVEVFDTRTSIITNLLMASIPLASSLFALTMKDSGIGRALSGFIYFLYFPVMFIHGARSERARKKVLQNS